MHTKRSISTCSSWLLVAVVSIISILLAPSLFARSRAYGFVEQGGLKSLANGRRSNTTITTPNVQQSFPGASVLVTLRNTSTHASIFNELDATKSNPFTADINGYWYFYADDGRYDVTFSGGSLLAPYTLHDVSVVSGTSTSNNILFAASYGAAGDGKIIYDAAMTNGSAILGSASARFNCTTDIPGKIVRVEGAGTAGAALATTIASCTDTSHLVLTASASTTVTSKQAVWGTRDTAHIQSILTAISVGTNNICNATVVFGNPNAANAVYLIDDTISIGPKCNGLTLTSYGFGYVSPDVDAGFPTPGTYQNVSIRWAGADNGKPMLWFKEYSSYNTVSSLGFYGGAEAIRYRNSTGSPVQIAANTVRNCHFQGQTLGAITIGNAYATGSSTDDMGRYILEDNTYYPGTLNGVMAYCSNGFNIAINRNYFYNLDRAGARGVNVKNWNNVSIRDSQFTPNGPFTPGTDVYAVESIGTISGTLTMDQIYAEVPYILHITGGGQGFTSGATITGLTVNSQTTNGLTAPYSIDVNEFLVLINSTVSTDSGGVSYQRSISSGVGGKSINSYVTTSVGGKLFDKYINLNFLIDGPQADDTNNNTLMRIPGGKFMGSFDSTSRRNLFGLQGGAVRLANDGSVPMSLEGSAFATSAPIAGEATLSGGTIAVASTAVDTVSNIQITRRTTGASGTPGFLTFTRNAGVGFTINSSSATDTSVVSWLVVN
jgi:hypothetical protein